MGVWLQDDTEKKSSSFLMGGHTDFSLFSPSTVVKNFSLDFWECFDKDHPRASCSIQIGISVDWTRICFQKSRGYCFRTISDACRNRGYLFWSRYVTRTIKLYLKRRVEKKNPKCAADKKSCPPTFSGRPWGQNPTGHSSSGSASSSLWERSAKMGDHSEENISQGDVIMDRGQYLFR